MSPNGPEQAGVDAEQRRIDSLDSAEDRKIDVGQKDRTPEQLGEIYLKKTNDLQGKIRDLQRQADVLRDKRDPAWQALENSCTETEQGLLNLLKTIDQKNVAEQTNTFAEKVLNLTTKLDAAAVAPENGADTLKKPIPLLISDMFENILKPTDQKAKTECVMLAAEATTHYTEADIRLVQSRLSLFEALPRELMTTLFPNQQVPAGKDVIYQLARGVLAASPNAFLITNPGPEDIIRDAREKGIDELKSTEKELYDKKYTLSQEIAGLAKRTSESADDAQIARNVQIVERAQQSVRDVQDKMQSIGTRVTQLDLALVRQDIASARGNGRTTDADRILIRVKEQYGATLEMLDPTLAEEAKKAEKTVALTPFEQVLKGKKEGRAVDTAVKEARESAAAADIVDQVRASTVVRFSQVANGDTYFSKRTVRDASGQDKSEFFRKYSYVDIINASGKKVSVALTPEAKQRIERLPGGTKPVILKTVTSLSFQTTGGGRGGMVSYKYTGSDFGASVLDAKDIDTVNSAGGVLDGAGKPVDMSIDPRAEVAREQISMQRSFTVSDYVLKPAAQLRKMDGKPYDKRLITIKTASGRTYEGMTVATDAWETLNKPAPDGMTLVLKREPRNILLRTPETEVAGRGSRAIRRVIDADMISASDLAYAKLNGDELTTANVSDPTKTETDSASDLVRKREEDSRDILRAMDQSEPIKQTTQAASAIGESMSHLQKIMSAGNEGTKRQAMVDFARAEAEPMLKLLRDPNTTANVNQALSQLRALKEANLGMALGGAEREINERIQSLEQFAELLQSGRVADIFETIMDKSKFDADTWARWFSTEFPKILAAIVVATAVVVTVIATCEATPLWAVAAAGAAGGIIGAELGAEGVRAGRKLLDKDVRSGRLAYSNRSRLGKYLEGQEVLDPVTGKKVPLEFIKDVANPYFMQEFAFSFVTTYATMGLGSIAASRMSVLAQNSKWVQAFAQRSPMANRVMTYMSQIGDDAVRAGAEKTSFVKQWFNESIDELKDEFIREKGVEAVLAQIDGKLGPAAAFLVTLARGFKPLKVPKSPGAMLGSFSVENTTTIAEVRTAAEAQGYPSIVDSGTYLTVTDHDGHTFELHPDKPAPTSATETTTDSKAPETSTDTNNEPASSVDLKKSVDGGQSLIAARRETGASPETTQETAAEMVTELTALVEAAASRDQAATALYIDKMGRGKLEGMLKKENAELTVEGKPPFGSVEELVQKKLAPKSKEVLANIRDGKIGLGNESYIGKSIRDLDEMMPGMDMEMKQALNRQLHEAAMQNNAEWKLHAAEKGIDPNSIDNYMEWLLSPDQTIEGGRPKAPNLEETTFAGLDSAMLPNEGAGTRLADSITLIAKSEGAFSRSEVEKAVESVKDPVDRAILLETAAMLEGLTSKAGTESLGPAERWKIMEFSARYLQDFRAADFKASPQQLLDTITDNAVNLAHQNIMDHMTLVGSSHGALHVLNGNSTMLLGMYDQLKFTPQMRVLAMQATFDHDMGYTKRTLTGSTGAQGVFDASKDHPLESTLRIEANREKYIAVFGVEGYETIRNAVLDHSDSLGQGQFEGKTTKLQLLVDENAPASVRVEAAVACVDCLATVSNLKASPFIRDNPDVLATMARIQQVWNKARVEGKTKGPPPADMITDPVLKAEADAIRQGLIDRIKAMDNSKISPEAKQAYITSLESTMTWADYMGGFAINLNLQMLGSSVSSDLRIDEQGGVHVEYAVDPDGLALIGETVGSKDAVEMGEAGIQKAAGAFGKLAPESKQPLTEFIRNAADLRSNDPAKRDAAEAYFKENGGKLQLKTNSNLIIDLTIGQNSEYTKMRETANASMRIDQIRAEAKSKLDTLLTTGTVNVEGVEGNVEISSVEAYNKHIQDTLDAIAATLPGDFVMPAADGQKFVPYNQAVYETLKATEGQSKETAVKTWQDFYGRMSRGGSAAPVQSSRTAA